MVIDDAPLFDLLQRAKAAETSVVIVEAAIAYARRLSGAFSITHLRRAQLRGLEFDHTGHGKSGASITRIVIPVEGAGTEDFCAMVKRRCRRCFPQIQSHLPARMAASVLGGRLSTDLMSF
jgi:hypothetical protein